MQAITKSPFFWLFFFCSSLLAAGFTFYLFPRAFSIIHVDISMDRTQAIEKTNQLAQTLQLKPLNADNSATFYTDSTAKTFIELQEDGNKKFVSMMQEHLYEPYTWRVRRFKPFDPNEVTVIFTPDGKPYGFGQTLSENEPGADLPQEAAKKIAEQQATEQWQVNLSEFVLVDASKEVQPSGRSDHVFVYERPDKAIGEGRYRLRLEVSGDVLTELNHFVKVPESFLRRYQEMRAGNELIYYIGNVFMIILYLIGGGIIGVLYLWRRHLLTWRIPLLWGIFVAVMNFGERINSIPLIWSGYNTALSPLTFLLQYWVSAVYQLLFGFNGIFILTLTFIAAEGLTRAAFGNHIQLWKLWQPRIATSWAVLGRTVSGYLFVPLALLFLTLFYLATSSWFGWWIPISTLFDPNDLATYLPWFNPFSNSFSAGFWEECLFRAIPLAGAALIGRSLKKERLFVISSLVMQAIVFGAAHASYASYPSYARLVELVLPSIFLWGVIYLKFGLLPTIITHYIYDLILFGLPVFVASSSGIWLSQLLIVVCGVVPLLVIAYYRVTQGAWHPISPEAYNKAWQPPAQTSAHWQPIKPRVVSVSTYSIGALIIAGILGLASTLWTVKWQDDAKPLAITNHQAIAKAHEAFSNDGIDLSVPWVGMAKAAAKLEGSSKLTHKFVWQRGGKPLYQQLLGSFIQPPHWQVRFARFSGADLIERARQYKASITDDGIFKKELILPEQEPGASISEQAAIELAKQTIKNQFEQTNLDSLIFISAKSDKEPNRLDWTVTFAEPVADALTKVGGQARITVEISGDKITDAYRYVHVPEEYKRTEQNSMTIIAVIDSLITLLLLCLFLVGVAVATRWCGLYPAISLQSLLIIGLPIAAILLIKLGLSWPSKIALFNTSQPLLAQIVKSYAITAIWGVLRAAVIAFLFIIGMRTRSQFINRSFSITLLAGICMGIGAYGLQAIVNQFAGSPLPTWANYDLLNYAFYPLVGFIDAVGNYLGVTIICLFGVIIMNGIMQHTRWHYFFGAGAALYLGFLLSGIGGIEHISSFVALSMAFAFLFILFYLSYVRFDYTAIPIAVATYLTISYLQALLYRAFPFSTIMYLVMICIVLMLGYLTTKLMRKRLLDQAQKSH